MRLQQGDMVGLVCCSDGHPCGRKQSNEQLGQALEAFGLVPVWSPYLYAKQSVFSGTGKERADAVNAFYQNSNIKAIFDISGGNVGNNVLEYLNYGLIRSNPKPFFGYSDVTTVLQAIYTKTGQGGCLYQLRNLVGQDGAAQRARFAETLMRGGHSLYDAAYTFLRGSQISGTVVGGNLRCLLKLAGTPYWPALDGKVLFLESLGGGPGEIAAMAVQLRQIGVFHQIAGLLLGAFSKMEQERLSPSAPELFLRVTEPFDTPVAQTSEIGHQPDSKALQIGSAVHITRQSEESQ